MFHKVVIYKIMMAPEETGTRHPQQGPSCDAP